MRNPFRHFNSSEGGETLGQDPDVFNVAAALDANSAIVDKYREEQQGRSTHRVPTAEEIAGMSSKDRQAMKYWDTIRKMNGGDDRSRSMPTSYAYDRTTTWDGVSDSAKVGLMIAGAVLAGVGIPIAVNSTVDANYGDARAEQYLTGIGYRNVREIGKSILFAGYQGCDQSDSVIYKFNVTTVDQRPATMAVCVGFWKGATARELR